jgi:hypothetical protein
MRVIENFFLWLAHDFDTPRYMFHTKLQAIFWSVADLVLIFAFLKIVDELKKKKMKKGIHKRFWLLYFSAALKIVPFFYETPEMFISLDFFICSLQYAILVYTIIADRKIIMALPKYFHSKKRMTT